MKSVTSPDPHVLLTEQGEAEWLTEFLREAAAEREQKEKRLTALALATRAEQQQPKFPTQAALKKPRKAS